MLAYAICVDDGALPIPIAWRGGRADCEQISRQLHAWLVARSSNTALNVARRGLSTALIGKWHLGFAPHFGPLKSGYDEFFGATAGGVDYFSHRDGAGNHDLHLNENAHHEEGYLTDLLSKRALEFVARASDKPFFLSLHYTAPHWPWETREDAHVAPQVSNNLFHLDGGNLDTYRRMIHHMDEGIGWIVDALRNAGRLDNTLIVFTSDNGGERFSDNWPLVGGKMDLTEGGIRVPYIAHWPSVIAPGSVSAQHYLTMDWSATMLELGGAPPTAQLPWDGVSLERLLRERGHTFARPMHWRMHHRGQEALREGDWKYLRVDGLDFLFNLSNDERERANLRQREPERLAQIRQRWNECNATMPPIPADAGVGVRYDQSAMPQR
jgi:arylsulfatase A-like enzyme